MLAVREPRIWLTALFTELPIELTALLIVLLRLLPMFGLFVRPVFPKLPMLGWLPV